MQPHSWRIPPLLIVLKLGGAATLALLAWAVGRRDLAAWTLVGVTTAGLLAWALRDLVAPVRLTADPGGLTVLTGFAGRRRLLWSQIERVRVDRRQRLGLRAALLEIDAGDTLHLLGRYDLGAEPDDVLATLTAIRAGTA